MSDRSWWVVISITSAIALLGCVVPGLLTLNPWFFFYGAVALLIAFVLAVWRLVERRRRSRSRASD